MEHISRAFKGPGDLAIKLSYTHSRELGESLL